MMTKSNLPFYRTLSFKLLFWFLLIALIPLATAGWIAYTNTRTALQVDAFEKLEVIRVYAKPPGKPPDMNDPFTLPVGATVHDLAQTIHRELAEKLKSAKCWGTDVYDGQNVHLTHILHDKDIRLREAHHRVRNNLTTAIGLLRLQAANKPDSHCSEALLTAENRLLNMLALYQKLYTEPKEGAAPVGRYLKPLAEEMIAVFANRSAVTLQTECDDLILDSKTLTTMGIVINELVTNAMKHAFEGKPGTISIGVHHDGDEVEFFVKDDGIGSAPEAPSPRSPSDGFGLFLVRSLAEQLSGSITIDGSDGTAVTIRFPHRSGGRQPSA